MADDRHQLERLKGLESEALLYPADGTTPRPAPYPGPGGYMDPGNGGLALVRDWWRRIRKHWLLILVLALIVTTIVTIEVFRTKSIYRAAATVDIGQTSRTVFKSGDTSIESDEADYPYIVAVVMKTNIRLLYSRPLLEDVVVALRLDQDPNFLDVTRRRSILEAVRTVTNRLVSTPRPAPPEVAAVPPIELGPGIERPQAESARLAPFVGVLSSQLKAQQVEDTRLLAIYFDHTNPELSARIVNTLADVFMRRSFESKVRRFNTSSNWLDTKTRELKAKLEQAEEELADFASRNNMFSTDGRQNLTTEKLAMMYGKALTAKADLALKESFYEQVRAGNVDKLPESFADPKTSALRNRHEELRLQAVRYTGLYGPENPRVVSLRKEMESLEKQIAESRTTLEDRLKADYERTAREEKTLREEFEKAKAEAVDQNQAVIRYGMLKQEVDISKGLYHNFLTHTTTADLQRNEQYNNMRLIDPAFVPGAPIGPDRLRMILTGLLFGLGLGLAIAFAIEFLDNTIKTEDDVTRYINLPTLGIIPMIGPRRIPGLRQARDRSDNLIGHRVRTENGDEAEAGGRQLPARITKLLAGTSSATISEAYRGLRTSVLLSSAGHPPKSILFTSSQPTEGKTTTAINTAISLAQLGSSIIIVDADMRRPTTHKTLGVESTRGLSTYLSRDIGLDGLIQELSIPNLSLLVCGPVPPNPAELISSGRMKELLRLLAERYDHIIIDSPPLISVSDPLILSTLVDGVILVVQAGKSTRNVVRRARIELAQVGAKIYGVVLNNVNLRREGYDDYYHYRYSSSYYHTDETRERAESGGD